MGSWQELDARYGRLTPALAFVVSITYMAGADGILQDEEGPALAAFFKNNGIGLMGHDELIVRGERYYQETDLETFLAEAAPLLNTEQKLCILTNIADIAFSDGMLALEENEVFLAFVTAFKLSLEELRPYIKAIRVKNNLAVFPQ